ATCVTYLVSWTSLGRIAAAEPAPERRAGSNLRAEIAEGLRYVLGDPALRAIAFCTASMNLFMSMVVSVVVLFLARTVGLPPLGVGLVLATSGVGGAVAALTVRRFATRLGTGRTIWLSALVTQPFGLLLPWGNAALFVAGWFVLGYGGTAYNIVQVSYRQASC